MSVVGRVQINRPGVGGAVLPPTIPDDPPPTPPDPGDYLALLVADGATAAWPLSENAGTAVYADAIGSNDASLSHGLTSDWASTGIGPSTTSPHFLGQASFGNDPNDLSIGVPPNAIFDVGTGDFSMETWLKGDTFPDGSLAFTLSLIGLADLSAYVFSELSGPGLGADYASIKVSDFNNLGSAISPTVYDDHALHHVVATRRSGSYFVIVDGIEVATGTPPAVVNLSGFGLTMAGIFYPALGFDIYSLHGQLSWCAWYPTGLTADQAAAHYAAGAP